MIRLLPASIALAMLVALGSHPALGQVAKRPAAKPKQLFVHKNIEQGWKSATKARKPLLVMFTSDGCLYCEKMIKETYGHPAIKRMLLADTETVLAHADNYPALVQKLGIRGFPSTVLVAPDGTVLDFVEGFVEPRAFAQRVQPLLAKGKKKKRQAKSVSSVAVSAPTR